MRELLYQALLRLMLLFFKDKMRRDYQNGSTWQLHRDEIKKDYD
jgi:hypothetical protein